MLRPVLLLALVALAAALPAAAQIPSAIPFQSRMVDGNGAPVAAGTVVQFAIYDAETAGNLLWGPETHTVTPTNGIVSVYLGDGDTPDPIDPSVFVSGDRYLEVIVGAETLAPRYRMSATAYAFRAETVAAGAIDANSIANNAVNSAKVADNTLTANDLATNSVTATEIAAGAVASAEVLDNSLTANDLAANSVGPSEVLDNSLTANDLAANSVGSSEVTDNSLTANDLATNSVGAAEIATNAVASAEVADNSLTANDLATNSVAAAEIAANAVGASEIATNAVGSAEIASNAVSAPKISDEPGAGYVFTDTDAALTTGVAKTLTSRTINLPTAGFVIATGTANFEYDMFFGTATEIFLSISETSNVNNGDSLTRHRIPGLAGVTGGGYRSTLSSVTVVQYTTSGNKTLHLVAEADEGISVDALDANLSLVFVPTAYGTVSANTPGRESTDIDDR